MARFDKINTFRRFAAGLLCLALYFVLAELVFKFTIFKGIHSDLDYFVSQTFSEREQEEARQFMKDVDSFGERGVIVPGTIVLKYKPAKTKSFTINSFGFRGEEFTKKRDDEYRIVFFGNSKLLGYLVPDRNTITAHVQEKLREHFKDKRKKITVFNMGFEAFDLQRSIAASLLYYRDLEADFVAFYSAAADMNGAYIWGVENLKPFAEGDSVPEILRVRHDDRNFKSNLLHLLRSAFVDDMLKFEVNSAQHDIMNYPVPPLQSKFMKDFPPTYAASVAKISAYFKQQNIPCLVVMPPLVQTKDSPSKIETNLMFQHELVAPGINHFTKECYSETIRRVMELPDVTAVNHSGIFNGMEETVFFDGLHLTPDALKISAEKIADEIIKILESGNSLD